MSNAANPGSQTMDKVSSQIVSIRAKAGNPGTHCPVCTRSVAAPARRRNAEGHTLEGCVDACHSEHLTPSTGSHAWHTRKYAKALRAQTLRDLRSL